MQRLAASLLHEVDHATHHLGEGILLAALEPTRRFLAEARAVLDAAPDPRPLAALAGEIDYYDAMLSDWEAFSRAPEGTFPEWCKERGRSFGWPTTAYYTPDHG